MSLRPPGANLSTKTAAMEAAQQRVTDLIKRIRVRRRAAVSQQTGSRTVLTPPPCHGQDEPEQSRSAKGRRQRVVEEMLVTEHTYVSNLEILLTVRESDTHAGNK